MKTNASGQTLLTPIEAARIKGAGVTRKDVIEAVRENRLRYTEAKPLYLALEDINAWNPADMSAPKIDQPPLTGRDGGVPIEERPVAEGYLNLSQVAALKKVDVRTIRTAMTDKKLEGEKVDGTWRFTKAQVDAYEVRPKIVAVAGEMVDLDATIRSLLETHPMGFRIERWRGNICIVPKESILTDAVKAKRREQNGHYAERRRNAKQARVTS